MSIFKKPALTKSASIFSLLTTTALVMQPAVGHAETFNMTAGSSHAPVVAWAALLRDFVVPESTRRAEELGHTINWTEAYSGVLYNWKNTLEGVEEGLADVGWVGTVFEPQKMPLHNVSYVSPFTTNDIGMLLDVGRELHEDIPAMNQMWTDHNQKLLGLFATDVFTVMTQEPIDEVADLDGLKIFAPGAVARWLEGTGAIGINAGLPDHYNGVKSGLADGILAPTTGIIPFKTYEVAPYLTQVNFGGSLPGALTMNLDTWNKMPPEMQEMFLDIGREYGDLVAQKLTESYDATIAAMIENPDVTVSQLSLEEQRKWAQGMPDTAGEWADRNEERGLPAHDILKAFMDGVRARGATPLRDWDQ